MRLYSSLWNADNWATRGGLVKIDWTHAPFIASYRNFNADSNSHGAWYWKKVDYAGKGQIQWVQKNYMIYNYCTDAKRFPLGFAPECYLANVFQIEHRAWICTIKLFGLYSLTQCQQRCYPLIQVSLTSMMISYKLRQKYHYKLCTLGFIIVTIFGFHLFCVISFLFLLNFSF